MSQRKSLTPLEKKNILAIISVGCSRETAARYVGCPEYRIRREMADDPAFAAEMVKAAEDSEVYFINKIRKAADKEQYWRAAAWALERRCPNRYAPRGAGTLTMDQVRRLLAKLADVVIQMIPGGSERRRLLHRIRELVREIDSDPAARTDERPAETAEEERD